jgi:hypothetical protein
MVVASAPAEEPVVVDGELVGWFVSYPAEYRDVRGVDGFAVLVKSREAWRGFVPVQKSSAVTVGDRDGRQT